MYKLYNDVIFECHKAGNSNKFIEFMLSKINETIDYVLESVEKEGRNISDQVNKLLDAMEVDIPYSANELMLRLGIKSKETLRGAYLRSFYLVFSILSHMLSVSLFYL